MKRDVRFKLDVNDFNKNIKWDKKENINLNYWDIGTTNNDDKNSQIQELWFEIPREYKKNDIIFKAHTTGGSHLAVKRALEEIMKLGYRWEGIKKDVREFFFKWEVWQGRTKNPQNRLIITILKQLIPEKDIRWIKSNDLIIYETQRKRASERRIKGWKSWKRDKWWRNRINIQG